MKTKLSYILTGFSLLALLVFTNCGGDDVVSEQCGSATYTISYRLSPGTTGYSIRENGNSVFTNDLEVTFSYTAPVFNEDSTDLVYEVDSNGKETIKTQQIDSVLSIFSGDSSPVSLPTVFTWLGGQYLSSSIEILGQCNETIAKSSEDVEIDENSCDETLVLDIVVVQCDPTVISWTSSNSNLDLTGATLSTLGKEIDLSQGSEISFPASEVSSANIADFSVAGGNICAINYDLIQCGSTGSISLNESISGGDDLTVTVTDADLAGAGDFSLTVSTDLGESESIILSETENGVFTGTLATILSNEAGSDNDGTLNIENGVVISVTYDDALDSEANDPAPITATVTVSGDFAPTCTDGIQNGDEEGVDCGGASCEPCQTAGPTVTFNGTTYQVTGADFISSSDNTFNFLTFSITDGANMFIGLELYDEGAFANGTYSFEAANQGVSDISTITIDNGVNQIAITGGSVTLTDGGTDNDGFQLYTLELNLTTGQGNLTGTISDIIGF